MQFYLIRPYGCFRLSIETGRSSRGSVSRKIYHTERNVSGNVREVFFLKKKKGEMKKAARREMQTCGRKRQTRPHSFFAFIPLATFGLPPAPLPPPQPFFALYSFGFDARLKQQRLQYVQELSWRVERVDVKTRPWGAGGGWSGTGAGPVTHQQVGPSSASLNMLVLLVTQPPAPLLCFLRFSTSAGFSPASKLETFPSTSPPPPPPSPSDPFLHPSIYSFFFFI